MYSNLSNTTLFPSSTHFSGWTLTSGATYQQTSLSRWATGEEIRLNETLKWRYSPKYPKGDDTLYKDLNNAIDRHPLENRIITYGVRDVHIFTPRRSGQIHHKFRLMNGVPLMQMGKRDPDLTIRVHQVGSWGHIEERLRGLSGTIIFFLPDIELGELIPIYKTITNSAVFQDIHILASFRDSVFKKTVEESPVPLLRVPEQSMVKYFGDDVEWYKRDLTSLGTNLYRELFLQKTDHLTPLKR